MIDLLVVTGVRLYRDGLALLLSRCASINVLACVPSVEEALQVIARREPQVVLLDVPLPRAQAATAALLDASAAAKVVALGVHEVEDEVVAWAQAGASGYVSRDSSFEDLTDAIESVARGELRCSAAIAAALMRRVVAARDRAPMPRQALTRRQVEVMALVERGLSNKEIALALNISRATVKNHVHNVFDRLEVHRRTEAVARLGGRA